MQIRNWTEDPFSPFHFILAVDFLGRLLNKATLANIFVDLYILSMHGGTKILQYTDDMLVFAKASEKDICVL